MSKEVKAVQEIKWPANDGFKGEPKKITLEKGHLIDRHGYEDGYYASPAGTPYTERSLPPSSQNKPLKTYEVLKPLETKEGEVAPAFGQKGGGIQYKFDNKIADLKKDGFIKEVKNK